MGYEYVFLWVHMQNFELPPPNAYMAGQIFAYLSLHTPSNFVFIIYLNYIVCIKSLNKLVISLIPSQNFCALIFCISTNIVAPFLHIPTKWLLLCIWLQGVQRFIYMNFKLQNNSLHWFQYCWISQFLKGSIFAHCHRDLHKPWSTNNSLGPLVVSLYNVTLCSR